MEIRSRIIGREKARFGDLADHPLNPKYHPPEQKSLVENILSEIGWIGSVPVYVSARGDGKLTLLDGHLRRKIAPDFEVDVDIHDLTDAEADLMVALYDYSGQAAQIDPKQFDSLLRGIDTGNELFQQALSEMGQATGLYQGNGNGAGGESGEGETTPAPVDKAEELQKKWQVKTGDIWRCGEHLFICGDCRETETWQRLFAAAGIDKVNGVFTSPPYAEQRKSQYGGVPMSEYVEWWEAVQANVKEHLADDGSFFVNIKPHSEDKRRVLYVFDLILAMVRCWDWKLIDELCWRHWGYPRIVVNKFKNCFEPVYHFALNPEIKIRPDNVLHPLKEPDKFKKDLEKYGAERQYSPTGSGTNIALGVMADRDMALPGNVLEIPQDAGFLRDEVIQDIHSATFPVKLPAFFIKAYSDPGDVWCDPFLGSGTTIVAAHNEGRRGLGIERLETYGAVILERLAHHTDNIPVKL